MLYKPISLFKIQIAKWFIHSFVKIINSFLFISILLFPVINQAQTTTELIEMPVSVSMKDFGRTEIPALIKENIIYLSVTDMFDFLKINNHITPDIDSISGYILNTKDPYLVDLLNHQIIYQNRKIKVMPDDIIRSGDNLFLISNHFGDIFGLTCTFYPRSLTVDLVSKLELPAMRAIRLEKLSSKFNPNIITFNADTTIEKKFKLLHFRSAEWNINSSHQVAGLSYTRLGLRLGGVLAGGDLTAMVFHTTDRPFVSQNQFYLWRYADNKNKVIRQIHAGKISVRPVSSVFSPIIGVQITNATTYNRRAFGFYSYRGYTEPNSLVELYVNNTLIDYIRADDLGFIQYDIPLSYGNTSISLRYFNPSGDEIIEEKTFLIPMTILPENEFEYSLSAGFIENREGSFYSQGRINYGLSEKITVGGGLEYINSVKNTQALPFFNASIRLAPNMLFSGEYITGTMYKGNLSYFSLSKLQFELNYVKFNVQQDAILFNYTEQRKALISMPFNIGNRRVTSSLTFNQNILGDQSFYNIELQLSLATRIFNINIVQSALFNSGSETMYTNISSSIRLPRQFRFSPRVIYRLNDNKLISMSLSLEKTVSRNLSVNATFEKRFNQQSHSYRLGIRCNLAYANLNSLVNISKNETVFAQSASGSIIYEKNLGGVRFMNNSNIGMGSVCFKAFLDLNANGTREIDEPLVKGIQVRSHSGGGKKINTDSTVMYIGLEPYIPNNFTIDGYGLENISWRINNPLVTIIIDPNQMKLIDVAVISVGEASGKVYQINESGVKVGIGRVNVNIYNQKTGEVITTVTESDGYFSYLGLLPGDYIAKVADTLLEKMNMLAPAESSSFTIKANIMGDIVDDLEIVLTKIAKK